LKYFLDFPDKDKAMNDFGFYFLKLKQEQMILAHGMFRPVFRSKSCP